MNIDIGTTPIANILALINEANPGLNMTQSQVTIGLPSARTPDSDPSNAQITVTALPNQGFSGSVTITYNRILVSQGVADVPSAVSINPADDNFTRIEKIATALGLDMQQIQVLVDGELTGENNPIPTPANEDDDSVIVTVVPISTSIYYTGAGLDIMITVPDTDVPLNIAVANTQMNGFTPAS